MLISGNINSGLAGALYKLYPDATYCSRDNGYDLTLGKDQERFAQLACEHDVVIISAALW